MNTRPVFSAHGTRIAWFLVLAVMLVALTACGGESATTPPAAVVLSATEQGQEQAGLPGSDASPPQVVPTSAAGAFGFSHYVFEDVGGQVLTTLVEGPSREQVRVPVSYQQLKNIHSTGGPLEGLKMSAQEMDALVVQLDILRGATEKYQDVDLALADGFIQASEHVPNMGAHFIHPARSLDGVFDPAKPEILMYTTDAELGWRLVGTSFVLPREQVGDDHPQTFAGSLDNWHVHYSLCTGPTAFSRSTTPQECSEEGNIWVPSYGWMIHAWVWDENPMGVFSMWNPSVPPLASKEEVRQIRDAVLPESGATATIENFSYTPSEVAIGENLTWTNVDGVPHTVTAGSASGVGDFDSGLIGPGQSFAVRFDQPGLYQFACSLHPRMTGTVVVGPE